MRGAECEKQANAKKTVDITVAAVGLLLLLFEEKSLDAPRPSGHPPVRGGDVKTFRAS